MAPESFTGDLRAVSPAHDALGASKHAALEIRKQLDR
jgi:hypothetical protein